MATILDTPRGYTVKSFTLRYQAMSEPPTKDLLTSPQRVAEMTRGIFNELDGGPTVEHFGACFLNVKNGLIGFKAFNTGTIDQVAVYPRMVIHTALMVGAAALILIHNHPSGSIDPSEDDKCLTNSLHAAGRLFDIRVLDHLIIAEDSRYYSFLEHGLIP